MKIKALEISELNSYIGKIVSSDPILFNVKVRGEISNFRPNKSGHVYLTLKDETSRLRCVIFSRDYDRNLKLEDGMRIVASGRISVYERDGSYQLYIKKIEKDGIGNLHAEFEMLKNRLYIEGLFNIEHKKKIPVMPNNIGVVTSETGAVIRDIINVISRRYPKIGIKLYPVSVQGDKSAGEIVEGIKFFNREKNVDTIIVGRGGGSIEELWSFNEEVVARAVYNSEIPIISAVGHEIDYTICDFVSDMRAPTPSAAAEIATPDINEVYTSLYRNLNTLDKEIRNLIDYNKELLLKTSDRLGYTVNKRIEDIERKSLDKCFEMIAKAVSSKVEIEKHKSNDMLEKIKMSTDTYIKNEKRNISDMEKSISTSISRYIELKKEKLKGSGMILHKLSPLATIDRGFCIVQKNEESINSIDDVEIDDKLNIVMSDGYAECYVESKHRKDEV